MIDLPPMGITAVLAIAGTVVATRIIGYRNDRMNAIILKVNLRREIRRMTEKCYVKAREINQFKGIEHQTYDFEPAIKSLNTDGISDLLKSADCLSGDLISEVDEFVTLVFNIEQARKSSLSSLESSGNVQTKMSGRLQLKEHLSEDFNEIVGSATNLYPILALKKERIFPAFFRIGVVLLFFITGSICLFVGRHTAPPSKINLVYSEMPGGFEIGHSVNDDDALALYFDGRLIVEPKRKEKNFIALAGIYRELETIARLTSPTLTLDNSGATAKQQGE